MMKSTTLVALVAAASAVSGCGGLARMAGESKVAPDEFKVVTKAPLVVPPDYELRPPRPGDPRPQELRPDEDARAALFGKDVGAQADEGEKLLVDKAGAEAVDPRIRDQVDLESAGLVHKNQDLADRILFFGKKDDADKGTPLDPAAEKARLDRDEEVRRALGKGDITIERDGGGFKLPGL